MATGMGGLRRRGHAWDNKDKERPVNKLLLTYTEDFHKAAQSKGGSEGELNKNLVSRGGKEGAGEVRGRGKGEAAREGVNKGDEGFRKDSGRLVGEKGDDGRDEGLRDLQGQESLVEGGGRF